MNILVKFQILLSPSERQIRPKTERWYYAVLMLVNVSVAIDI